MCTGVTRIWHGNCLHFLYSSYKRPEDNAELLARACLRMLAEKVPAALDVVLKAYATDKKFLTTADEVYDMLERVLICSPRNFILIDALDELSWEARSLLLSKLQDLQRRTPNLKLLFTMSKMSEDIEIFPATHSIKIYAPDDDID